YPDIRYIKKLTLDSDYIKGYLNYLYQILRLTDNTYLDDITMVPMMINEVVKNQAFVNECINNNLLDYLQSWIKLYNERISKIIKDKKVFLKLVLEDNMINDVIGIVDSYI